MYQYMLMVVLMTLFVEIIYTNTLQVANSGHFETYNRILGKAFNFVTQGPLKWQTIICLVCNIKDG